jgi:hypothetical protein
MRLAGNVAHRGRRAMLTRFWWNIQKERNHLEGLKVDRIIILRWTFKNKLK